MEENKDQVTEAADQGPKVDKGDEIRIADINRFWDFATDLIDNDTMIIIGLLLVVGWVMKDIQGIIIGGLLTTLKTNMKP